MQITLRSYQQPFYLAILESLTKFNSTCAVLPTGGGKSVVIGKLANELPGRTLILTHRAEILQQNSEWLHKAGILSSKVNTLRYDNKTVIAMVQTLFARIEKYGIDYIGHIDNIVLDEVQILIFEKVFSKYNYNKLIGFTGTPVLNKRKETVIDEIEFVEQYTLSEIFDDLVQGPDTQDLIDLGYLTQDYNIALRLPDFNKLKESDSSPDGYTKKSLNEVYSNTVSLNILSKAYTKYCKGKKVLIFNASTKINKLVYNHFKKQGLNVKMFDSVNNPGINPSTNKKWKRDEIIEWFKNERDAILINTDVFTTGFNVTDVEVVVVNRATKSLSLWIQMVGRGSRVTDKIYKDKFTVIDLGQNIHNHGIWSSRRNWKEYFYSPGMKRKRVIDLLDTWTCTFCEAINLKGETECKYCNHPKEDVVINGKKKKLKEGEFEEINDMPLPRSKAIINYTKSLNEGSSFAFRLLERQIINLFIHYNVSKDLYKNRREDYLDSNNVMKDGFKTRIQKIFTPIYFAIIKDKELKGVNKTINVQLNRILTKIDKLYE